MSHQATYRRLEFCIKPIRKQMEQKRLFLFENLSLAWTWYFKMITDLLEAYPEIEVVRGDQCPVDQVLKRLQPAKKKSAWDERGWAG